MTHHESTDPERSSATPGATDSPPRKLGGDSVPRTRTGRVSVVGSVPTGSPVVAARVVTAVVAATRVEAAAVGRAAARRTGPGGYGARAAAPVVPGLAYAPVVLATVSVSPAAVAAFEAAGFPDPEAALEAYDAAVAATADGLAARAAHVSGLLVVARRR